MDNELKNIDLGKVINSAMEGPYGPLAIAVLGIVAVFGIYMFHSAELPVNLDVS